MERALALLISAHFIADFPLQPDSFVKRKRAIPFLILHGLA